MREIKKVRRGTFDKRDKDGKLIVEDLAELELYCPQCKVITQRLHPQARVNDVLYCHKCGNVLEEPPVEV